MNYTYTDLLSDVRKEAENLRVHATKEERERLSTEILNGQDPANCIYGLCTGSCVSARAHELLTLCCPVYIDNVQYDPYEDSFESTLAVSDKVGTLESVRFTAENYTRIYWISPIEAYIMLPFAKEANLIAYLRGETETLEL